MVASLPSQTITGTSAADIRASTPGVNALVETLASADTITLNNDGDYAVSGDGADSIRLGGTASVSLSQSIVAGYGNDTINLNTAADSVATFGSRVEANQGDDSIGITGGGLMNAAFLGGGLGNDTIAIQGISNLINSDVNGGDNGDSIVITSGGNTNSFINGNKGADVISVNSTASSNGSVSGGAGHDTITLGTANDAVAAWINGGAGLDSITLQDDDLFNTISGGGLADTISLGATLSGGVIYGDKFKEVAGGSGDGGTADGADLISNSGTTVTASISVYGAGGADTISIANFTQTAGNGNVINGGNQGDSIVIFDNNAVSTAAAASVSGGNGADTITLTTSTVGAQVFAGAGQDIVLFEGASAVSIQGGAGLDTITFTNATGTSSVAGGDGGDLITIGTATTALDNFVGSGSITGGNGADTISFAGFVSAGSITGGAGNDTIKVSQAVSGIVQQYTAGGSISGGAGTDTISFVSTAAAGSFTAYGNAAGGAMSAGIASIAYAAGDVINVNHTALAGGGAYAGLIYNASTAGFSAAYLSAGTTAGVLSVYSDGTDTYFAFNTGAGSGLGFRVTGADLVTTAASDNTSIAGTTANFGFTLTSSTSTGITITLA